MKYRLNLSYWKRGKRSHRRENINTLLKKILRLTNLQKMTLKEIVIDNGYINLKFECNMNAGSEYIKGQMLLFMANKQCTWEEIKDAIKSIEKDMKEPKKKKVEKSGH